MSIVMFDVCRRMCVSSGLRNCESEVVPVLFLASGVPHLSLAPLPCHGAKIAAGACRKAPLAASDLI